MASKGLILTSAMNFLMSWVLGNQEGLQGLSSWTANFDHIDFPIALPLSSRRWANDPLVLVMSQSHDAGGK
jgi:hypothetical protein